MSSARFSHFVLAHCYSAILTLTKQLLNKILRLVEAVNAILFVHKSYANENDAIVKLLLPL